MNALASRCYRGRPGWLLGAAEDEAGDVVRLARGAGEVFDAFHEQFENLLGVLIREAADDVEPAMVREFFAGRVEGFDDAVGEQNQRVTRFESDFRGGETSFGRDAQGEAAGFEALGGGIGAADDGGIVAGGDVGKAARGGIEFGEDGGGEALAAPAVGASILVEADGEFGERKALCGDRAQAGLKRGHQESSRHTFTGDVGHDQHEFAAVGGVVSRVESVIVILGYGVLRTGVEGNFGIGNLWRSGGHEPGLDFAGDFEVALHGDFVGELQRKKEQKEQSGEKFVFDFDGVVVAGLPVESGKEHEAQGEEKEDAAGRGELVHHGPEELFSDGQGALPGRELVDFVPVDVLAVEAVARAGIGGELRPEVVDLAVFADALPEIAEPGMGRWVRFGCAGSWWGGRSHLKSIGERGVTAQRCFSQLTVEKLSWTRPNLLERDCGPNRSRGRGRVLCPRQGKRAQTAIYFLSSAWICRTSVSISSLVSLAANLGMWPLPLAMTFSRSRGVAGTVLPERSDGPPKWRPSPVFP